MIFGGLGDYSIQLVVGYGEFVFKLVGFTELGSLEPHKSMILRYSPSPPTHSHVPPIFRGILIEVSPAWDSVAPDLPRIRP